MTLQTYRTGVWCVWCTVKVLVYSGVVVVVVVYCGLVVVVYSWVVVVVYDAVGADWARGGSCLVSL